MFVLDLLLVLQVIIPVISKTATSAMLDFLIFVTFLAVGNILLYRSSESDRTHDKLFLAGLMCFALGHISLFGMLFVKVGLNVFMAAFPIVACAVLYFISKSDSFDFEKLFTFVWAYALLISANLAQCVRLLKCTGKILPTIGMALLVAAAVMRLMQYFYDRTWQNLVELHMITYYLGMEILVLSMTSIL